MYMYIYMVDLGCQFGGCFFSHHVEGRSPDMIHRNKNRVDPKEVFPKNCVVGNFFQHSGTFLQFKIKSYQSNC